MKCLLQTILKEFKLIFRNGLTLYLTVSPALLALVFILVFGSVRTSNIPLVTDGSLPAEQAARLETVADVAYADGMDAMIRRVDAADSVAGVYWKDGGIHLLVEGNEGQAFTESRRQLLAAAPGAEVPAYATETVEISASPAYVVSITCVLLLALFIGGAALGLSGVDERESRAIRAISVSPMSPGGYILSKIIPALLLGVLGVSACALMIGRADALPQFLLLALCSVFVGGMIVFLMIGFADNQIAAVGVLKIIMPGFLVIGAAAIFVPDSWLFPFYLLPMYWQYAAINAILSGGAAAFPLLMVLAVSLPWFAAVMLVFKRRVPLKVWR